jgi:hypothetical protein
MTSPRQRKKRAALLARKKKLEEEKVQQSQQAPVVQKMEPKVEAPPPSVVESASLAKPKKIKLGFAELKSQDQVVEQPKEEVKTSTGE